MSENRDNEESEDRKRKRRSSSADNQELLAPTSHLDNLAQQGFTAIPIQLEGKEELRNGLLKGTSDYFASMLDPDLHQPVLSAIGSDSFDFRDIEQYTNIMDPKWRKNHLEPSVNKAVRKALSGNICAQGQPGRIIAKSGFGIFTHLRGLERLVVDYFPKAIRTLQQEVAEDLHPTMIGHLLFKPPVKNGGSLKSHMDGGTMAEAFQFICQHPDTSMKKWVHSRPHRVQVLLHIEGGRNGATNVLAPMTIPRLGFVLATICPEHMHTDMPKADDDLWTKRGGPIMYDWYCRKSLQSLNRLIQVLAGICTATPTDQIWIDKFCRAEPFFYNYLTNYFAQEHRNDRLIPFSKTDIVPDDPNVESFLAVWPGQFIHGSSNTSPGLTRLSLTIPASFGGERDVHTQRALARLHNMSDGNWDAVRADVQPYHGGSVHKENIIEVENYPFFHDLYVKPTTDLSALRSLFHNDDDDGGPVQDTEHHVKSTS